MSRVTVIFEDDSIIVDGKAATFAEGEVVPENDNFTAIQWYGKEGYGFIEVKVGDRIRFTDIALVQPYIDQHAPRFAEIRDARIEREQRHDQLVAEAEQSNREAEEEKLAEIAQANKEAATSKLEE